MTPGGFWGASCGNLPVTVPLFDEFMMRAVPDFKP
jgi:hypothetical protein